MIHSFVFPRDPPTPLPDRRAVRRPSSSCQRAPARHAPRCSTNSTALQPFWNLFDLTPEGRPPDWYEQNY